MQNVVGPILAVAMKFGLGAEIQSPTGLSVCVFVCHASSNCFLFLDGIEPFFGRQFSMWHSTKLFFFDF